MSLLRRRAALTAVLSAGCVAGVLVAVPAEATPVEAGSVTMTSEPGDFIGLGGSCGERDGPNLGRALAQPGHPRSVVDQIASRSAARTCQSRPREDVT
jgi:hypothetical protein